MLVLVADDYDHAAAMLAQLVECVTPFQAMSAKDGKEALELAGKRRPDAAILDIDMPQIGGIEVARMLRVAFGDRRPRLIGLTVGPLEAAEVSGMFDHVLQKPVPLDRLVALLTS